MKLFELVLEQSKDAMFNSDSFLTILKTSDSVEELQAVKEKVDLEIARQRSNDTGGEDGIVICVT
jgi:sorting nexin-13